MLAAAEYIYCGHDEHCRLAESTVLYESAVQDTHGSTTSPIPSYPPLQAQVLAAATEREFSGHCLHCVPAVTSEYVVPAHPAHDCAPAVAAMVPMAQALHTPPAAPEYPALHLQCERLLDPAGAKLLAGHPSQPVPLPTIEEYVDSGHGRHAPAVLLPVCSLYSPAAQLMHTLMPGALLYVPGAHNAHASCGPV